MVIEYIERAWDYLKDNPGAVVTGIAIAVLAFVILKVGSFLAGIGG
jgi:hypothetical protein